MQANLFSRDEGGWRANQTPQTAQTKDWEERDVSWKQFRRDMQQTTSRGRLARRIGVGR